MKIPGIMVTDAKSLRDHSNSTGEIPKHQTMIDLWVARTLVDAGAKSFR